MITPVSASEAYLLDFHARKPGATTKQMANAPVVVGGVAYPSSYAYLAASAPTSSCVGSTVRVARMASS